MTAPYEPGAELEEVGLFPLPQVVLFPGMDMPLHVFEPRYRALTRDVLAGSRRICIVQIPEEDACGDPRQPRIATVAGVGEIATYEELSCGRFNILVSGMARVELTELPFRKPYRRARARVLGSREATVDPALLRALTSTAGRVADAVRKCHPTFRFDMPGADDPGRLADACSHFLIRDGAERQRLLETLDVGERIEKCLAALAEQLCDFDCNRFLN
jgi:ATP-dependent Lon protease